MTFEVIPAIDVAAGRLAIYTPEGPAPVRAGPDNPLAAAADYARAGARWLHVVDMDLAFGGRAMNLEVVREVASLGVHVQASGGIHAVAEAEAMLGAGAERAVLASGALGDEALAIEAIATLGSRLVVGIEVREGRIRSRTGTAVDLPIVETLGWLTAGGAAAFLVTAVARVGTLGGPDVDTVKRVVRSGVPVVAAGGISSSEDLRALRRAGAVGAVVGRGFLEGSLDLAELLAGG